MKIKKAFVTGGTGFIGTRLIRQLVDNGTEVTCLIRKQPSVDKQANVDKQTKIEALRKLGCQFVDGDLQDQTLALPSVEKCDVLFHLAAATNAARPKGMLETNPTGTRNLLEAVLRSSGIPRFISVSSLAACGPSNKGQPRVESDAPAPVSFYGRSKLRSEQVLATYADRIPVSIVRPPIVLGQGDPNGLRMFKLIQKYNCNLIPGWRNRQYSVIHVDDLANALIHVACQGQPIASNQDDDRSSGIYFAASDQLSYAELGRKIGLALGRPHSRGLYIARPIFWGVGAFNSLLALATNRPRFLNLDKYREAFAGDWACSAAKLLNETDFHAPVPLQTRLEQTVEWYQDHGWLNRHSHDPVPA